MEGLIRVEGLRKAYGPTVALDGVTAEFEPGRVHALMGKNGSGKSTLVKLLAGVVQPDAGRIEANGREVSLGSPADALANRIVTVHQELSLVPGLSVGENIYLGRLPYTRGPLRRIDWARVHRDAGGLLADMGLDIDPRVPVGSLSVGRQQVIEIAKAMSFDPTILLLDEPTSALAQAEVEHLFALIARLKARGVTMVYITHRMSELFDVADTCTVLRDGRLVGRLEMADATPEGIVEMMFGDVARARRPAASAAGRGAPVLEVRGLTRKGAFEDVSFTLHRGEILGFAGMLGAGRTEVLRAIFGADPHDGGTIVLQGEPVAKPTPREMKRRGVGYTPENRKEVGLVQPLPIHDNLCMASLPRIAPGGLITRGAERPYVARQIEELDIKVANPMLPAATLSGGNQQKIVIGNWLNTEPSVMFFDEPSRGIDVQAKQQIFEIMWREAQAGIALVFVSTEAEELIDVCDRILVMREGRIVAEVLPHETSIAELYALCMAPRDTGAAAPAPHTTDTGADPATPAHIGAPAPLPDQEVTRP